MEEGGCPKRTGHVAVCQDDYLLVWGGYNERNDGDDHYLPGDDLWVYNKETHTWQKINLNCYNIDLRHEKLPYGTSGATANIVNGYLYLFGGHNALGNTNHIMRLDLKACKWEWILENSDSLPSPRDKLTSWVYGDKLYFFGGYGCPLYGYLWDHGEFVHDETLLGGRGRGWNNQLLVFDTHSNTWANPKGHGDIPSARAAHDATLVGKVVFLFGGRHQQNRLGDLYQLDLNTFTWNAVLNITTPQPIGRSWHTFSAVTETILFLYGGYTQDNRPLDDAWFLDISSMQWSELQLPKKNPRLWHTTCVTKDEDILVFGGCSNDILDQYSPIAHCNDVLEFRVSPKALLRLCLDAVYTYRNVCESYWDYLPKHLNLILRARVESKSSNATPVCPYGDGNNHGLTCVLS